MAFHHTSRGLSRSVKRVHPGSMEDLLIRACRLGDDKRLSEILHSPWGKHYRGDLRSTINTLTSPGSSNRLMHTASLSGEPEAVCLLYEWGGNINIVNDDGETPLHLAARHNHCCVMAQLLFLGADINAVTKSGTTPLHYAAQASDSWAIHTLLTHQAILVPNVFADVNAVAIVGHTPLHYAAMHGNCAGVLTLLVHGAHVNVKAIRGYGFTPLHLACLDGREQCVRHLLEFGADPMLTDRMGRRPSRIAKERGYTRIANMLREKENFV